MDEYTDICERTRARVVARTRLFILLIGCCFFCGGVKLGDYSNRDILSVSGGCATVVLVNSCKM